MKTLRIKSGVCGLLAAIILLSSCASILNSKSQKITMTTDNKDNNIYLNDSLIGSGKTLNTGLLRDHNPKDIRIERDGYEDKNYVAIQEKISPLYIMSWIPFVIVLAPFYDYFPKAYNYSNKLPIYTAGRELPKFNEGEKYIFVNKAEVNFEPGNYSFSSVAYNKYLKKDFQDQNIKSVFSNEDEITDASFEIKIYLNEGLYNLGYLDTTEVIFKRATNTLYIDVQLLKYASTNVYQLFPSKSVSFMYANVDFIWTLRDAYKQVLYEEKISTQSDVFGSNCSSYAKFIPDIDDEAYSKTFRSALDKSLNDFLLSEEVKQYLPVDKDEEMTDFFDIVPSNSTMATSLGEAVKSCVTIKLTDRSHGSGFFINDNLILSNYHVVAGADTVTIITNNGTKITGNVIRTNTTHDLALIEVKSFDSPNYININNSLTSEIGDDIFAIGTPSSVELTQTVSKGIISGYRTTDEMELIQTDVSINPGNSGGPLVDSKGNFIGVVNAKLIGSAIEGIGFGIPKEKVIYYLKLSF